MKKSEAEQIIANILTQEAGKPAEELAKIIIEVQDQLGFLPPARQVPVKIQTYPEHTYEPETKK